MFTRAPDTSRREITLLKAQRDAIGGPKLSVSLNFNFGPNLNVDISFFCSRAPLPPITRRSSTRSTSRNSPNALSHQRHPTHPANVSAEASRFLMEASIPHFFYPSLATRRCKSVHSFLKRYPDRSLLAVSWRVFFYRSSLAFNQLAEGTQMKQSDKFRENAGNCAMLAKDAKHGPARIRYKRMETAWLSLADEQDWLDG
jgi:hypothetical protein